MNIEETKEKILERMTERIFQIGETQEQKNQTEEIPEHDNVTENSQTEKTESETEEIPEDVSFDIEK